MVSETFWDGGVSEEDSHEMARMLLEAGADPDFGGGLPLVSAVSFNAIRVVEALLDGGAAVDGVDHDGVPIAYPLAFGLSKMAEYLADCGALLDLQFAAGLGRLDVIASFFLPDGGLRSDMPELADPYGFERKRGGGAGIRGGRSRSQLILQSLWYAGKHGHLRVMDYLIELVDDVNGVVEGISGDSPASMLHQMCWFAGDLSADVRAMGFKAAEERRLHTVRFLLEHGADPTTKDPTHGATALGWAEYSDPSSEAIKEVLTSYM